MNAQGFIPQHYRAVLRFGDLAEGDMSMLAYTDAFLRLYMARCGLEFDADRHAKNLLAFQGITLNESCLPVALGQRPEVVLRGAPPAVESVGLALQRDLKAALRDCYPLVPGEAIVDDYVTVLTEPFLGYAEGTVAYVRQSNIIRLYFVLPQIRFDLRVGKPSLVQPVPGAVRPRMSTSASLMVAPSIGVIQSVSTNLAFALPSPSGPFLAAGLAWLFGCLFGGGDEDLAAIEQMIQSAVVALEAYLSGLQIDAAKNDVHAFFLWVNAQVQTRPDGSGVQLADIRQNIETLESTYAFQSGSLFNDLVQISTNGHVTINEYVSRDKDAVLEVILLNVTALIYAQKMIALLSSVAAVLTAPSGNACANVQADADYQTYIGKWIHAVNTLRELICGSGMPPDPAGRVDTLDQVGALLRASPSNTSSDVLSVYGANAPLPWSGMSDFAFNRGWAAAIDRLVLHRQVARLLQLSPVTYFDERGEHCVKLPTDPTPTCSPEGSDGYRFSDTENASNAYQRDNHRWTSGCCQQNDHCDSAEPDVSSHWISCFDQLLVSVRAVSDAGESWGGDLAVTEKWMSGVASLVENAPPASPANTMVIQDGSWSQGVNPKSQWRTAAKVSYALTSVDANGHGQRSVWTPPIDIPAGAWQPLLRHVPQQANSSTTVSRQIWRQFVFRDAHGDPTDFGLPTVVGTLFDANAVEWRDVDQGLVS